MFFTFRNVPVYSLRFQYEGLVRGFPVQSGTYFADYQARSKRKPGAALERGLRVLAVAQREQ